MGMGGVNRVWGELAGIAKNLRRNSAGNTLAIMAAALIPLAAFSGSAIDMARLYVVKVRLQQACDAGALAGRRFMADTTLGTIDDNAKTKAISFFNNNFKAGWFGTTTVSFTPVKTVDPDDTTQADIVTGTAKATVPMTIMAMFSASDAPLTVTCQAQYDIPDLDIMFVLDTTGSMACTTADSQSTCDTYAVSNVVQNADGSYSVTEKSSSRIAGLRSAVLSFFDTVTTQADPKTNFRFGFVPYSATVNVGHLLPASYLADSWSYQSRVQNADLNNGSASASTQTTTKAVCDAKAGHSAWTTAVPSSVSGYSNAGYTANNVTTSWVAGSGSNGTCTITTQPVKASFTYKQVLNRDVSTYKTFAAVTNPAAVDGSTSTWNGCIEERGTSVAGSFSASSPPMDLDVDTVPSSTTGSQWGPMWFDQEFMRQASPETSSSYRSPISRFQTPYPSYFGSYEFADNVNEVPCPAQASAISAMTLPAYSSASVKTSLKTTMTNYMKASSGFRPYGNTYHDVGITWGTRLLSSSLFTDAAKPWTDSNTLHKFIIFLTDGAMEPDQYAYASHGIEALDGRVTGTSNTAQLLNYHNARFTTACTIAKNHSIRVFVIAFAQTMTTQLQGCATSSGDAYYASNTTALNAAFTDIAKKAGTLRVIK